MASFNLYTKNSVDSSSKYAEKDPKLIIPTGLSYRLIVTNPELKSNLIKKICYVEFFQVEDVALIKKQPLSFEGWRICLPLYDTQLSKKVQLHKLGHIDVYLFDT